MSVNNERLNHARKMRFPIQPVLGKTKRKSFDSNSLDATPTVNNLEFVSLYLELSSSENFTVLYSAAPSLYNCDLQSFPKKNVENQIIKQNYCNCKISWKAKNFNKINIYLTMFFKMTWIRSFSKLCILRVLKLMLLMARYMSLMVIVFP